MPYRTFDDRIDGQVITFFNTSDLMQVELKLLETEQIHRALLNSSPDAIIKISTDWKILEFNPEAEKYFGKRSKDVVNQNFIKLFILQPAQKKVEKEMSKLMNQMPDGKYKTKVIAAGGKTTAIECSFNVLLNNLKMPSGMILSLKTKPSYD
jgi:PAS domain S-box-containing protein